MALLSHNAQAVFRIQLIPTGWTITHVTRVASLALDTLSHIHVFIVSFTAHLAIITLITVRPALLQVHGQASWAQPQTLTILPAFFLVLTLSSETKPLALVTPVMLHAQHVWTRLITVPVVSADTIGQVGFATALVPHNIFLILMVLIARGALLSAILVKVLLISALYVQYLDSFRHTFITYRILVETACAYAPTDSIQKTMVELVPTSVFNAI